MSIVYAETNSGKDKPQSTISIKPVSNSSDNKSSSNALKIAVDIFQTLGIIAGFIFTGYQIKKSSKIERFNSFWKIGESHRDVWSKVLENPSLNRVLEEKTNLEKQPISTQESMFINMVILHLENVFQADKEGFYKISEQEKRDIGELFNTSLFMSVWKNIKKYQNESFRTFIDVCYDSYGKG